MSLSITLFLYPIDYSIFSFRYWSWIDGGHVFLCEDWEGCGPPIDCSTHNLLSQFYCSDHCCKIADIFVSLVKFIRIIQDNNRTLVCILAQDLGYSRSQINKVESEVETSQTNKLNLNLSFNLKIVPQGRHDNHVLVFNIINISQICID